MPPPTKAAHSARTRATSPWWRTYFLQNKQALPSSAADDTMVQCGPTQTSSQRRAESRLRGRRLQASIFYSATNLPTWLRYAAFIGPSIAQHKAHNCDLILLFTSSWQSDHNKSLQKDQRVVWHLSSSWPLWSFEPNFWFCCLEHVCYLLHLQRRYWPVWEKIQRV